VNFVYPFIPAGSRNRKFEIKPFLQQMFNDVVFPAPDGAEKMTSFPFVVER
jgi:hypothetical protein